jgi:hypothetical protein
MGMTLGLTSAILLMLGHTSVFEMITRSAEPEASILVIAGSFIGTFSVGATITGLIFEEMDVH